MATSLSPFLPTVGGMNYDLLTLYLNISSLSTVGSQSIIVEGTSVSIKVPDLALHCTILPCVQAGARKAVMGTDN